MKDRHKGILVAIFGVLAISPDAVLVRFLSDGGKGTTDPWVIIFWKLVISITVSAPYAVYETGGLRRLYHSILHAKYYYLSAIPVQGVIDMGLTFSLIWTSAANALLLLHLNPLWCAVLGRVFLGDKLPRRTILALTAALGCMMLIFVPDIVDRSNSDGDGDAEQAGDEEDLPSSSTSTKGNVTAFFTGIMLAVYIAIVRKAGMENNNNTDQESNNDNNNNTAREKESDSKEINLVGATSLSALLVSMIVLITRHGNVLPDSSWRGGGGVGEQGSKEGGTGELWQFWLAMVADGMALGIIVVCLAIAPRLANGAEVALVLLLEVILGPLWVFLAYRDVPSMWTMIGGSILIVVLAVHESVPLFEKAHREFSKHLSGRLSTKSKAVEDTEAVVDGEVVDEHDGRSSNGRDVEDRKADA